jgi:hypothetical protein
MAGIDDVLERLLTDAGFARLLAHDPRAALAGYELTEDDLALLSSQVSFDRGAASTVEERVSKAGIFGLLSSLGGLGQFDSHIVAPVDSHVVAPADSTGVTGPTD